jgi:hypothetical protein
MEVVDEPHQETEIIEERESTVPYLLQDVLKEREMTDIGEPMEEPVETSEQEIVEEAQLEVPFVEKEAETTHVSLYLAKIFGKSEPSVAEKPRNKPTERVKPDLAVKATESQVEEKPRKEAVEDEEHKSVFSFLKGVLKESKR